MSSKFAIQRIIDLQDIYNWIQFFVGLKYGISRRLVMLTMSTMYPCAVDRNDSVDAWVCEARMMYMCVYVCESVRRNDKVIPYKAVVIPSFICNWVRDWLSSRGRIFSHGRRQATPNRRHHWRWLIVAAAAAVVVVVVRVVFVEDVVIYTSNLRLRLSVISCRKHFV